MSAKSGSRYRRKQRERLFREQDGLCHLCSEPMRLVRLGADGVTDFPPDAATVGAVEDRWSPLREEHGEPKRYAVYHRACVQGRSNAHQNAAGIETLHALSGRFPVGAR
jgi:hypothetical protein